MNAAESMMYALSEHDNLKRQEEVFRSIYSEHSRLSPMERLVWGALATECGDGVNIFNMRAVCAKTSCTPKQVQRALASLQVRSLVELRGESFTVYAL